MRRRRVNTELTDAYALGQIAGIQILELRQLLLEFLVARFLGALQRLPQRRLEEAHLPQMLFEHLPLEGIELVGGLAQRRLRSLQTLAQQMSGSLVAFVRDEQLHLVANCPGLLFPGGELLAVGRVLVGFEQYDLVVVGGAGEEGLQAVVVLLENRVELVVVALGAAEG